MPIYEYRCSACGHKLESLQKLADAPLVTCPSCGKQTLTKLLSAAGFQLKGSGWYATDFKGSGGKPADKAADTPSASKDGDAKATETKTETKTEAKTEARSEAKSDAKSDAKSETKTDSSPAAPATGSGTPSA
jgi:putative FmdB family regulatory protein